MIRSMPSIISVIIAITKRILLFLLILKISSELMKDTKLQSYTLTSFITVKISRVLKEFLNIKLIKIDNGHYYGDSMLGIDIYHWNAIL